MQESLKKRRHLIEVDGVKKELLVFHDGKGNILHKIISPLIVEFSPKDVLQVIIGATLLAIPVGYTEEAWNLGAVLPNINILFIMLLSILFISSFIYHSHYKDKLKNHKLQFITRILSTYIISFLVVSTLLTLIDKAAWSADIMLSFRRVVLVTFPASMSAAIADVLK